MEGRQVSLYEAHENQVQHPVDNISIGMSNICNDQMNRKDEKLKDQ